MTVAVKFPGGLRATITLGVWTAPSSLLSKLTELDEQFRRYEWHGSDPDMDHTSALHAVSVLGGEILSNDGQTHDPVIKGVEY